MFGFGKNDENGGYGAVPNKDGATGQANTGSGGGMFGGMDIGQISGLINNIQQASQANDEAQGMINIGREKINALVKYAEEGDWTWKVLGLFGGLAMMGTGALSFMGDFFLFNYFGAVLDVYIFLFGILSVCLEYKESILPTKWVDQLKIEAKFMYKPYGRAVLYFFFGVLLISQSKLLYLCTGLYLCVIGGLVVYYAGNAQKALQAFKDKKLSFFQLRSAYDAADKNKDGLTPGELAKMVSKFPGVNLSENELISAIGLLDTDASGKVSYEEFSTWYNAR